MIAKHFERVVEDIVIDCKEDYVGLWVIAGTLKVAGEADLTLMESSIEVIREVSRRISLEYGQFEERGFIPWDISLEDLLHRVRSEWVELGRKPTLGDIVWFTEQHSTSLAG